MELNVSEFRLNDVKCDIVAGLNECNKRGLLHAAKWLAELKFGMDANKVQADCIRYGDESDRLQKVDAATQMSGIPAAERDGYDLGMKYFQNREYARAAFFTSNAESPVVRFLHLYSQYMSKEKWRLNNLTDMANLTESGHSRDQTDLSMELKRLYGQRKLDGYSLYLYGIVLKKLDLREMAITVLVEAINAAPILWSAYLELMPMLMNRDHLEALNLPNHWMKTIFTAYAYIELFLNDDGLKLFEELQEGGFKNCINITAQMALAYHNKRNVEKAIESFQHVQVADPHRLDNLDVFSNLLFVKEMKKEMAELAHRAVEIDKYRPETCCVIGNYYSIRADHQKAVLYFQRALKLDPQYLSAWTLMGHEFLEMKNSNAAIQSYRKAVEVNRRDYRAWYGLGQSYEILKMPSHSLYYYKIAQDLRPYDSRMMMALGDTYEQLERYANAVKCYQKACNMGDIEGVALLRLGNLYEKLGNIESAVPVYIELCKEENSVPEKDSLSRAYITLGNYYESLGKYDDASHFAYKCLNREEVKTEAQALLNTIKNKRNLNPTALSVGPIVSAASRRASAKATQPNDSNLVEMSLDESDMVATKTIEISDMVTEDDAHSDSDSN